MMRYDGDVNAREAVRQHFDHLLDRALLETFPGSDPIAISVPDPVLNERGIGKTRAHADEERPRVVLDQRQYAELHKLATAPTARDPEVAKVLLEEIER